MNFSVLFVFFGFFMVGLISARPNPNPNPSHRVHRAKREFFGIKKLDMDIISMAADAVLLWSNSDGKLANMESNWLQLEAIPQNEMPVRLHSDVTIICDVTGSPAPVITWLKNGVPIEQTTSNEEKEGVSKRVVKKEFTGDSDSEEKMGFVMSKVRAKLSLQCLRPEDEAEYTCVAQNAKGKVMATTNIVIQENDSHNFGKIRPECEHKLPMLFSKSGTPAYISSVETLHMEFLGSDVLLPCHAVGHPRPKIQWTDNNGQQIVPGEKFKVNPNGSLFIKDLSWSDMGLFSCKAENSFGHDSASTFIYPLKTEVL